MMNKKGELGVPFLAQGSSLVLLIWLLVSSGVLTSVNMMLIPWWVWISGVVFLLWFITKG